MKQKRLAGSTHVTAVLEHAGGDIVVVDACSRRIDAGKRSADPRIVVGTVPRITSTRAALTSRAIDPSREQGNGKTGDTGTLGGDRVDACSQRQRIVWAIGGKRRKTETVSTLFPVNPYVHLRRRKRTPRDCCSRRSSRCLQNGKDKHEIPNINNCVLRAENEGVFSLWRVLLLFGRADTNQNTVVRRIVLKKSKTCASPERLFRRPKNPVAVTQHRY